jgi:hypothetical protein
MFKININKKNAFTNYGGIEKIIKKRQNELKLKIQHYAFNRIKIKKLTSLNILVQLLQNL